MGYEINYFYHERIEGEYNKEEVKSFKKKVGDPFEDYPLERLAGAIIAQLARRDIWIINVEIYELSKKQISFKETKGGIIIKNKKFLCEGSEVSLVVEDINPQINSQINIEGQGEHPHNSGPKRPIDWMVFSPEPQQMLEVQQKSLRFTPDKKYPVFEKKAAPAGIGEIFQMLDDTGREQLVSDKYFVPGNVQLFADKELRFSETSQARDGGKLYWGNAAREPDMPNIRK